jgi:hypothetical protein
MKKPAIFLLLLSLAACSSNVARTEPTNAPATQNASGAETANGDRPAQSAARDAGGQTPTPGAKANEPKTVREFFALLPDQYFTLEGCDRATDKNCDRARAEYLKSFLKVDDAANGYLEAGCDGAQSCLTMALFKRTDGTYLVGVNRIFEMGDDYYFLDYRNGKWSDVSAEVVPEFSRRNMYELPRYGTTVTVFAKKIIEEDKDFIISDKGARLYELKWNGEKFAKK